MALARVTVEILGAVPITEIEASTSVSGRGARCELLAGEVRAGGRPVLRARAWRVLRSPVGDRRRAFCRWPCLQADEAPPPTLGETFGYAHAVEWRWAVGGWEQARAGDGLDADADPDRRG